MLILSIDRCSSIKRRHQSPAAIDGYLLAWTDIDHLQGIIFASGLRNYILKISHPYRVAGVLTAAEFRG
jgi:hypothetical protein